MPNNGEINKQVNRPLVQWPNSRLIVATDDAILATEALSVTLTLTPGSVATFSRFSVAHVEFWEGEI